MASSETLRVSLSAIQAYRQCQQLYSYRYVESLQRRDRARPLELGSILHRYLEVYYRTIQTAPRDPTRAHELAQSILAVDFRASVDKSVSQLRQLGLDDQAREMRDLLPLAKRLTDRYYNVRGRQDAKEYRILLVEHTVEIWLSKKLSIISNGKLDMLTQQRATGKIHLWENKSTGNVPSIDYRLRDLQTTLYAETLYSLRLIHQRIDAVIWNYIYTKEPTVPELLKNGELTRRANLDSTWEIYAAAIAEHGLDLADYQEQKERLDGRELSVFFPRHEQVILAKPQILLRDYLQTAREIKRSRAKWIEDVRAPVRTLTVNCDWCEFKDLCNAHLLSGSDRDARARFEKRS